MHSLCYILRQYMKKSYAFSMYFKPALGYNWPLSTSSPHPIHFPHSNRAIVERYNPSEYVVPLLKTHQYHPSSVGIKPKVLIVTLKNLSESGPDFCLVSFLPTLPLGFETPVKLGSCFNRAKQSCPWTWHTLLLISGCLFSHLLYFPPTG